jgi:hypothetical protein
MNVPVRKDPARRPCPKCALPTDRHCPNSRCGWRKCRRCGTTLGKRAMDRDGRTVP